MPGRLRWYALGLGIGVVWLFLLLRQLGLGEQPRASPVILLLLGGLAVAAYQLPVVMGPDRSANVVGSPLLVGALLSPADDAMALALGASLAGNLLFGLARPTAPRPRQPLGGGSGAPT